MTPLNIHSFDSTRSSWNCCWNCKQFKREIMGSVIVCNACVVEVMRECGGVLSQSEAQRLLEDRVREQQRRANR